MTRKNFIAIANILAKQFQDAQSARDKFNPKESLSARENYRYFHGQLLQTLDTAQDLAGYFQEENANFNYERFMLAVTGEESTRDI